MEYRNELKYVVSDLELEKIRYRLLPLMPTDEHQREEGYFVRSIYFDDIYDSYVSENEEGTDYRKKYRIRIYNGNTDLIRLEKKIKCHGMTRKVLQRLSRAECDLFLKGDLDGLYEVASSHENCLIAEVYCGMLRKNLMPKCIVEYQRFAFVENIGNVRITFDCHIAGSRQIERFYEPETDSIPVMPDHYHMLEVKYDELLPHYILQAIDTGNLQRQSFSKYCAVRTAIG